MNDASYGQQEFQAQFDVSRETMRSLEIFHDILLKWNARINLISRADAPVLWRRHFADSAQLLDLARGRSGHWADIGAGAGLPGLVLAALAQDDPERFRFTLIESDQRKSIFLTEAARAMRVSVTVRPLRAEALAPLAVDVLSARALAPLDSLLSHLEKHRRPDGIGLFPKGEAVHKEIEVAKGKWRFDHRIHPSVTDPGASIVEVGAVASA